MQIICATTSAEVEKKKGGEGGGRGEKKGKEKKGQKREKITITIGDRAGGWRRIRRRSGYLKLLERLISGRNKKEEREVIRLRRFSDFVNERGNKRPLFAGRPITRICVFVEATTRSEIGCVTCRADLLLREVNIYARDCGKLP
jgi:hypothetical protein